MSNALSNYFKIVHFFHREVISTEQKREFALNVLSKILSGDSQAPEPIKRRLRAIVNKWSDPDARTNSPT